LAIVKPETTTPLHQQHANGTLGDYQLKCHGLLWIGYTASDCKAGFYSWTLTAIVEMHNCALLNGNTQLSLNASLFETLQLVTRLVSPVMPRVA